MSGTHQYVSMNSSLRKPKITVGLLWMSLEDLVTAIKEKVRMHVEEIIKFHYPSTHRHETIEKVHEQIEDGIINILSLTRNLNYDSLINLKTYNLTLRKDNQMDKVRIAAFDILMRATPSTTIFNKILTHMIYETDLRLCPVLYQNI